MKLGRMGRMAYINTLPVDWGFVGSDLGRLVFIQRGAPTQLNRLLSESRLDVSPVASVAAAEHSDNWLVFDHLCIGCRGEVGSVILRSDCPVEELDGACVAVTSDSATVRAGQEHVDAELALVGAHEHLEWVADSPDLGRGRVIVGRPVQEDPLAARLDRQAFAADAKNQSHGLSLGQHGAGVDPGRASVDAAPRAAHRGLPQ